MAISMSTVLSRAMALVGSAFLSLEKTSRALVK